MNIHEFQAKELMRDYKIGVPQGMIIRNIDDLSKVSEKLPGDRLVVKAQIHAGGRGKGGGVKLAQKGKELHDVANSILGMTLVTHQTGTDGQKVRQVLIEEALDIEHEYYVGIVLDRSSGKINMMASSEGGMEIEEVAKNSPEKIIRVAIDPSANFSNYVGRKLAFGIGLKGDMIKKAIPFFRGLFQLYKDYDCTIAEVNPMITTKSGDILALDGKLNFDDNATFRHPRLLDFVDKHEGCEEEAEAAKYGLSYISLDGDIGCLVNGAGLAMATMDIIKLNGGNPANFLDVGGGATTEAVTHAFSTIIKDKGVKAILVNIFGGIMRCDVIAEGITKALENVSLNIPLVVRLEGTNVSIGKKILSKAKFNIITADDFEDAAKKAVAAAKGNL